MSLAEDCKNELWREAERQQALDDALAATARVRDIARAIERQNEQKPMTDTPNRLDTLGEASRKHSAAAILNQAAHEMKARAVTYDKPEGERSMAATVAAFRAVTGHDLTEEQGWLFMTLLKAVRSQQGAYRADSYIDGAAYFSLTGEAAARDRSK